MHKILWMSLVALFLIEAGIVKLLGNYNLSLIINGCINIVLIICIIIWGKDVFEYFEEEEDDEI